MDRQIAAAGLNGRGALAFLGTMRLSGPCGARPDRAAGDPLAIGIRCLAPITDIKPQAKSNAWKSVPGTNF
jgi:hypothetical protein